MALLESSQGPMVLRMQQNISVASGAIEGFTMAGDARRTLKFLRNSAFKSAVFPKHI